MDMFRTVKEKMQPGFVSTVAEEGRSSDRPP